MGSKDNLKGKMRKMISFNPSEQSSIDMSAENNASKSKLPTKAECLAMSEEEYQKLSGKAKSKAALVRSKKKPVPNPKGRNQYTTQLEARKFLKETEHSALKKLNEVLPDTVDIILGIAKSENSTDLNKLRAAEILLAYQIARPAARAEKKDDEGAKTFIVLPPDAIIDEQNIVKMPRMQNPEGEGNKK